MRNGFPIFLLATLTLGVASTASAQCRTCGHPGPYGVYENLRSVPIFGGGSLEQIPAEPEPAPTPPGQSGRAVAKVPALRRTAAGTSTRPASTQITTSDSTPAAGSSRRNIARDGAAAVDSQPQTAPPADSFRIKQPRAVAPGEAAVAPPAAPGEWDGLPKADPSKGRIPKYRYSGSTFPYYFGRSYVNYPHYEQWHEPATDARRQERKLRFLNTFFEPLIDFTHGVQTEHDEPPKPAAAAK